MNIAMSLPVLGCLMAVIAIGAGSALAALKSRTIDIFVGVVIALLVLWIVLSRIRF